MYTYPQECIAVSNMHGQAFAVAGRELWLFRSDDGSVRAQWANGSEAPHSCSTCWRRSARLGHPKGQVSRRTSRGFLSSRNRHNTVMQRDYQTIFPMPAPQDKSRLYSRLTRCDDMFDHPYSARLTGSKRLSGTVNRAFRI